MASNDPETSHTELQTTPLHALHIELGAKMVPFAGYDMPVSYPDGLLKEHRHTRSAAGLFDVSHMGQATLTGASHADLAAAIEALVPGEIAGLEPGRVRYTQLLNKEGGILDDLMITRLAEDDDRKSRLFLVVNAACKHADFAHISRNLPAGITLDILADRALIALQGPHAAEVITSYCPGAADLDFMEAMSAHIEGAQCFVTRCGYTGEDGFEISIPDAVAEAFARSLLGNENVKPIGLGARDTLRLEAGLCLYGHDIDETTSPVEAGLTWSIGKRRRGEGGFPGAARIQLELSDKPSRKLTGFKLEGRAPAREGCEIALPEGDVIGRVTSGSFAPSLESPIAMGYVPPEFAQSGTPLNILIRGKTYPATTVKLPFVSHSYYRKTASGKSNG